MVSKRQLVVVIVGVAVVLLGAIFASGVMFPSTTVKTQIQSAMTITSPAFKNGERVPAKYTCDGQNISPPLSWADAPKETKTYALIVDDPDAPAGTFTHWVIFNIPATITSLDENIPTTETLNLGAVQGRNGAGRLGYIGPCPPSGTHHYNFHLYALDTQLKLQAGATKQDVLNAMQGHTLAQTELTGLYSKG